MSGCRRRIQANLIKPPGAHRPGRLQVDAGAAQFDNRRAQILIHRHEEMRAARRDFDEAQQAARLSVRRSGSSPHWRSGSSAPKRKRDARRAGMQLFEQI